MHTRLRPAMIRWAGMDRALAFFLGKEGTGKGSVYGQGTHATLHPWEFCWIGDDVIVHSETDCF